MPEFINPSHGLSNGASKCRSIMSPTEESITIIDLSEEAVSFSKSNTGAKRSLLLNNYKYKHYLQANECEEMSSENSEETGIITKDTNIQSGMSTKMKTFLICCGVLVSVGAFVILVLFVSGNRAKGNDHSIKIEYLFDHIW